MQQSINLTDALDLFILDCQSRRFTEHTLRFYRGRLGLFLDWCNDNGVTTLDDLTPHIIRRYLVSLQERDLSSAYIHSHGRAIRTFCNYLVRDDLLSSSPFAKVKMPTLEKKILPALTDDEIATALQHCRHERDRVILLFLVDSGVRATECVALDVADANLKTGQVTVTQGKGRKDRSTFIGAKVRKRLKLYLMSRGEIGDDEPLFASLKGGGRLTYYGLAQMLKVLRRDSGIDGLSAHACRRTFAINCLRNGMDIFVLARLMGHSDIHVLRQYLDLLRDDLQNAHNRHGPVDNL